MMDFPLSVRGVKHRVPEKWCLLFQRTEKNILLEEKNINLKHFSDIETILLSVWAMHTVGGTWRGELMELETVEN